MSDEDRFFEELKQVRATTRNLIDSVIMDVWPRLGAIVDFGLESQKHYEALYYPIREHQITPAALDAALGHGEELTALARGSPINPHKDVEFSTSWDAVFLRGKYAPDAPDGGGVRKPPGKAGPDFDGPDV